MLILGYAAIGTSVAATRLVLDLAGRFHYSKNESTWVIAVALTDILWWPVVIGTLLLRKMAQSTSINKWQP